MQLLKITSTPIEYEMKMERPRLEINNKPAKMRVNRQPAQLNMQSRGTKVKIDTTEARASVGLKTNDRFVRDNAADGVRAADQATAQYAEIGTQMAQIQNNANLPDIMSSRMFQTANTELVFLPNAGPEISWEPGTLNMDFTPSKLDFQWDTMNNVLNYIPGDFSVEITQYPSITIEYLGGPVYVPASANPNYVET